MQEYAVDIKHLSKVYKLYNKSSDRVLEAFGIGGKKRRGCARYSLCKPSSSMFLFFSNPPIQ